MPDTLAGDASLATRVRARLMRHRAWRLARRFGLIFLFSLVIGLLLVQTRNTQTLQRLEATGEAIAAEFQAEFDRKGTLLPLLMPDRVRPQLAPRLDAFEFNPLYPILRMTHSEVGVCCSARPVPLFLRSDVRMVIIFDGRRFRAERMIEEDFQRRREALGLDARGPR
jgi:hypothetical protein